MAWKTKKQKIDATITNKQKLLNDLYAEYDEIKTKLIKVWNHYLDISDPRLKQADIAIPYSQLKKYRDLIDSQTYNMKHYLEYIIDRIEFVNESETDDNDKSA